jgi:flagellar motor switch protein FliG
MRQKQHRITIFLDDDEIQRLYNAVAREKMIPSRLVRKVLMDYLDKLDATEWEFEGSKQEDTVVEDKEPLIL